MSPITIHSSSPINGNTTKGQQDYYYNHHFQHMQPSTTANTMAFAFTNPFQPSSSLSIHRRRTMHDTSSISSGSSSTSSYIAPSIMIPSTGNSIASMSGPPTPLSGISPGTSCFIGSRGYLKTPRPSVSFMVPDDDEEDEEDFEEEERDVLGEYDYSPTRRLSSIAAMSPMTRRLSIPISSEQPFLQPSCPAPPPTALAAIPSLSNQMDDLISGVSHLSLRHPGLSTGIPSPPILGSYRSMSVDFIRPDWQGYKFMDQDMDFLGEEEEDESEGGEGEDGRGLALPY